MRGETNFTMPERERRERLQREYERREDPTPSFWTHNGCPRLFERQLFALAILAVVVVLATLAVEALK